jgi:hypothetical protein
MKSHVWGVFLFVFGLLSSFSAFAESPGGKGIARDKVTAGTARGDAALSEVQGRVPDEAAPAIRRSREASRTGSKSALEALDRGDNDMRSGAGRASGTGGLDEAEGRVRRGTGYGQEALGDAAGRVPDEAKPAIRDSREYSRTGERRALEGLGRGRDAGEGPGRPSFGGGGPGSGGAGRGGRP